VNVWLALDDDPDWEFDPAQAGFARETGRISWQHGPWDGK
jgi:hypothetical protein